MNESTKAFLTWYKAKLASKAELKNWLAVESELINGYENDIGNAYILKVVGKFKTLGVSI